MEELKTFISLPFTTKHFNKIPYNCYNLKYFFQLEDGGPYAKHFKSLNLFAYGTYKDYLENKADYLELTPAQCKKLQHLTIATLATQEKCIPYSVLLDELDIKNVRDLEDLIIEAIYAGEIVL